MAQADIDDPTLVAILRLSLVAGVGPRTRLALLERWDGRRRILRHSERRAGGT
jgi:hypothetical protein